MEVHYEGKMEKGDFVICDRCSMGIHILGQYGVES